MEKRVVLAIALTVGLWVVWLSWFAPKAPPPPPPGQRPAVAQGTVGAQAPGAPSPDGGSPGGRKPSTQYPAGPDESLSGERVVLTVASKGAALKAAEAWACANPKHGRGAKDVTGDPGHATAWVDGMAGALGADLLGGGDDVPDLARSDWKLRRDGDAVVAEFETAGLLISRSVRLTPGWFVEVVYTVRNVSAAAGAVRTLEIVGPVMPPLKMGDDGVLVAAAAEEPQVELESAPAIHKQLFENPKHERRSPTGKWAWIGARSDFYLGALVPRSELPADTTVGFRTGFLPPAPGAAGATPTAAATFRIPLEVPPQGQEKKLEFAFYAGPNQGTLLHDEASPYYVLRGATVQRTFIISLVWVSTLLAWLLKVLASTGMGYGLAVLALTVIVRGALFPLSRKSQISMRLHAQKMQRVKPKLDAVKEKYKDPKKQQEATMKIMREEKVSLLPGGCLLAFAQMPIWIALYSVLQTTFEMRHAGFLWVSDLTAPDHVLRLAHLDGWKMLDEGWLNLLPLLMMVVWYLSAAMQPLPADPQQAQTQKMMRWMPVLMGFFLYGTAAGLTLYMTMSALWSIGETWVIRKLWLSKLENALK